MWDGGEARGSAVSVTVFFAPDAWDALRVDGGRLEPNTDKDGDVRAESL
jgi:hypothetical protein